MQTMSTYFYKQTKVDVIASRFLAMNLAILVVTDVNSLQNIHDNY